jgi:hypothetical protein
VLRAPVSTTSACNAGPSICGGLIARSNRGDSRNLLRSDTPTQLALVDVANANRFNGSGMIVSHLPHLAGKEV